MHYEIVFRSALNWIVYCAAILKYIHHQSPTDSPRRLPRPCAWVQFHTSYSAGRLEMCPKVALSAQFAHAGKLPGRCQLSLSGGDPGVNEPMMCLALWPHPQEASFGG